MQNSRFCACKCTRSDSIRLDNTRFGYRALRLIRMPWTVFEASMPVIIGTWPL